MSDPPVPRPDRPTIATLRDGREVLIRPLRPEDVTALRTGLARMSPDSRYHRFVTAMPALSDALARYFTDVDGVNHVAFGASDPAHPTGDGNPEGLGIATARYVRTKLDRDVAEIAVTVIDEYQGLGLGGILLDILIAHATQHDVGTLTATMLAENHAIRHLLEQRGFELHRSEDASIVEGNLRLDPDRDPTRR